MPFAIGNTTELSGSAIAFKSNTLTMAVDGEAAAAVPKASKYQSFSVVTITNTAFEFAHCH